jgi:hypothetical protein
MNRVNSIGKKHIAAYLFKLDVFSGIPVASPTRRNA